MWQETGGVCRPTEKGEPKQVSPDEEGGGNDDGRALSSVLQVSSEVTVSRYHPKTTSLQWGRCKETDCIWDHSHSFLKSLPWKWSHTCERRKLVCTNSALPSSSFSVVSTWPLTFPLDPHPPYSLFLSCIILQQIPDIVISSLNTLLCVSKR